MSGPEGSSNKRKLACAAETPGASPGDFVFRSRHFAPACSFFGAGFAAPPGAWLEPAALCPTRLAALLGADYAKPVRHRPFRFLVRLRPNSRHALSFVHPSDANRSARSSHIVFAGTPNLTGSSRRARFSRFLRPDRWACVQAAGAPPCSPPPKAAIPRLQNGFLTEAPPGSPIAQRAIGLSPFPLPNPAGRAFRLRRAARPPSSPPSPSQQKSRRAARFPARSLRPCKT